MNGGEFSFIELILEAGIVVKFVMLLLLLASIWSWAVILNKLVFYRKYRREARQFEERFAASPDVEKIYTGIVQVRSDLFGMQKIFIAGYKEYFRLQKQGIDRAGIIDGANRTMQATANREIDALETWLPLLATVGSTAPYLGLLGTVWGIMNSFIALGQGGATTLAMVAPGIAEALTATAMGLAAAIPAVIFYNRFATEAQRLYNKYEIFTAQFAAILRRQKLQ